MPKTDTAPKRARKATQASTTPRNRNEFLERCDPSERAAYELLFTDLDALAVELGDTDPGDPAGLTTPLGELPIRLRLTFEDPKGCALRLQHPKLSGLATLLWAFPSRAESTDGGAVNRLSATLSPLARVGVQRRDADAFKVALEDANFESGGTQSLKTCTAGLVDGISRIFNWPSNRTDLAKALRGLVKRIDTYPSPVPVPAPVAVVVPVG